MQILLDGEHLGFLSCSAKGSSTEEVLEVAAEDLAL